MEKDRRRKKKDLLVSCVHDDDMKERAKVVCDFRLHPSTPSFLQSIKISSAFVMTRYFFFSSSFLIFFVVLCMLCTALYTHSKDFHPFFSSNAKSKRIFIFFFVHYSSCTQTSVFGRLFFCVVEKLLQASELRAPDKKKRSASRSK